MRRTPLYEQHRRLGARMGTFAGYEMPIQYTSILQEHRATRGAAGIFDLSHMGEVEVIGEGSFDFLQWRTTNDLGRLRPGRAQYTLMLNDSGGIEDDLVLYHRGDGRFLLVVNGANRAKIVADLAARAPAGAGVQVADRSDETALVAVQGPQADAICRQWAGQSLASLRYYEFAELQVDGIPCLVSRTGYTGEDGFELYVPAAAAPALWDTLLALGRPAGAVPAGLGARDTLRLEMGYCLYGHEIDRFRNPLEAGLAWVVKPEKGDFVGREALLRLRERGVPRSLVGLVMEGPGIPRQGYRVFHEGAAGGEVTSGSFSPVLNRGIALAYVPAGWAAPGTAVEVEVRGERLPARVTRPPFVAPRVRR